GASRRALAAPRIAGYTRVLPACVHRLQKAMALIRFLIMLVWALVFVVLLLFAIKNVEPVTLRFYFDRAWDAPLIVVILAAFAAGALFGFLACVPSLVRQRRNAMSLRRELRIRDKAAAAMPPPSEPSVEPPATSAVTDVSTAR